MIFTLLNRFNRNFFDPLDEEARCELFLRGKWMQLQRVLITILHQTSSIVSSHMLKALGLFSVFMHLIK